MDPGPLIDEELAAFLQGGISMHAAAVVPGAVAQITRGAGCRISADRREVTVYVVEPHSRELLEDVRSTGRVAVAFTKPKSHRTVQLKGADARVGMAAADELAEIDRQVQAFDAELHSLGFPQRFGWTLAMGGVAPLATITFTPTSGFVQTPGPAAGVALKGP